MNLDNLIAIDQLVGYPQRDLAFDLSAPGGCIRGFSITSHTVGMTDGSQPARRDLHRRRSVVVPERYHASIPDRRHIALSFSVKRICVVHTSPLSGRQQFSM